MDEMRNRKKNTSTSSTGSSKTSRTPGKRLPSQVLKAKVKPQSGQTTGRKPPKSGRENLTKSQQEAKLRGLAAINRVRKGTSKTLTEGARAEGTTVKAIRRLMTPFASKLSQTSPTWARLIAPVAEWFARTIHDSPKSRKYGPPDRLTQSYRRTAQGGAPLPKSKPANGIARVCRGCGKEIERPHAHCNDCMKDVHSDQMKHIAHLGRVAKVSSEAQAKRASSQQTNRQAIDEWVASDHPAWLTREFYFETVKPRLTKVSCTLMARRLNVSYSYADHIRKGRIPHPRHWQTLAEVAGVTSV